MKYQSMMMAAVLVGMSLPTELSAQGGFFGRIVDDLKKTGVDQWNQARKEAERAREETRLQLEREARRARELAEKKAREALAAATPTALTPLVAPSSPAPKDVESVTSKPVEGGNTVPAGLPEIVVHKPPMQFLEGRTAKVVADQRAPFHAYPQLTLRLEQALREGFSVENGPADLIFTFSVVSFRQPTSQMTIAQEPRMVRLANGRYIERPVPIKYWNATGALNLDIVVRNRQGVTLANHKTTREFRRRLTIEVNHQSAPGGSAVPSNAELFDHMVADCVEEVANQFVKTTRRVPAELSNDRALRPGIDLARVGQWDKAIELWKAAKTGDEADRALNLGAGYEALAYDTYRNQGSVKEALPLLNQATEHYEQFLKTKREWFGDRTKALRARLEGTKANFERALEREEFEKRRIGLATANGPRQQTVTSSDGALTEKEFRRAVRNQLQVESTPEVKAKLHQDGVELFGLTAQASALAISQEAQKVATSEDRKERYRRYFAGVIADGKIEPAEQELLRNLTVKLQLDESERAAIEKAFRSPLPAVANSRPASTVSPR